MNNALLDKIVVEVDGRTLHLKRRTAHTVKEMDDLVGDKWLITDFGRGAQPHSLTLDAPVRYAETVAARRLQELGEFQEGGRILCHWKQARDGGKTEMFCTPVPGEAVSGYEDRSRADGFHHLVFSVNSLLYSCLKRHGGAVGTVVLFEHDRHVDFAVGKRGKVLASGRVSAYSADFEARKGLAEAVAEELRGVQERTKVKIEKVVHFAWLVGVEEERSQATGASSGTAPSFANFGEETASEDTGKETGTGWASTGTAAISKARGRLLNSEWVRLLAKGFKAEAEVLKPQVYDLEENQFLVSSISRVVDTLSDSLAINGLLPVWLYRGQRLMPVVALGAWLLITGVYFTGVFFQKSANHLQGQITALEDSGFSTSESLPPTPADYKEILQFSERLSRLKEVRPVRQVLSDLSFAEKGEMAFDSVRIEYDKLSRAVVTLSGRIASGFAQSSADHEAFLNAIRSKGYEIVDSRFSTDINSLTFNLKLAEQ
ncbi:MAG: hypothetical protein HQL57_09005 [Magnetococcales bacterium]|nr:hypothetical protein [Magnetococcales bacterium]MBF0157306.1 hypothetical protein [Magnetococcales bacterium]